jgi:hypothetical protein
MALEAAIRGPEIRDSVRYLNFPALSCLLPELGSYLIAALTDLKGDYFSGHVYWELSFFLELQGAAERLERVGRLNFRQLFSVSSIF